MPDETTATLPAAVLTPETLCDDLPRDSALERVTEVFFNSPRPEKKEVARESNPKAPGPKRVSITHEGIINWLIENPGRPQRDCALFFDVTQAWLSTIIHSDAFQERLRQRQDEIAALVGVGIQAQLRGGAAIALERLTEKLTVCDDREFLLDATDKLFHRLGFAPKSSPLGAPTGNSPALVQNNQYNITVARDDLAAARELMQGRQGSVVEGSGSAAEGPTSGVEGLLPAPGEVNPLRGSSD